MSSESPSELKFDIGDVLFIDIVGYSTLSIKEQRAAIDELTKVVRASGRFQNARAAARLTWVSAGVLRFGLVYP